ncbi:MAG: tape measure protein [Nitrosopumilus sp.]
MSKTIVEYVLKLTDKISPTLKKIQANIGLTDKKMKRLDQSISGLGVGLAGLAIGFGAIKAIKIAGEFERTGIAFETMLGSVEKGQQLLKDLDKFATKTPFSIQGVQDNAKLLLAVGIEAEKLIPTMKALGDVSAGLSVPLQRIALNYGQVRSQGKLTGRELRDFAVAGVPLIAQLAKQLGVAENAIAGMVSKGTIKFAQVEQAFIDMSSEGGRFANLMNKQNKTFLGQYNEMTENVQILARTIGQTLIPIVTPFVNLVSRMVGVMQRNKTAVIIITKVLVLFVTVIATIIIAIKAWSIAQAILNTIMMLNPVGLIIAGIVLLIGIIAIIVSSIDGWGEQWKVLKNIFSLTLDLMKNQFKFTWKVISHAFLTALDLMKIAWLKAKKVLGIGDDTSNKTQVDALTEGIRKRTQEIKDLGSKSIKIAKDLKKAFEFKLKFKGGSPIDNIKKEFDKFKKGGVIAGTGNATVNAETKVVSASPKVFNINIQKLVETFNVNTQNMKEAPAKVKEMIEQTLLEALADLEIAR